MIFMDWVILLLVFMNLPKVISLLMILGFICVWIIILVGIVIGLIALIDYPLEKIISYIRFNIKQKDKENEKHK